MSRANISEAREPSQAEIDMERMLRAIHRCGDVRELRAFNVRDRAGGDFRHRVVVGYFDDIELMVREALRLMALDAEAIYYTPNPVNPDLLARAVNRCKPSKLKGDTTSDEHITRRVALLIDVDPVRLSGISSSDAEHDAARARIWRLTDWLEARGLPLPIVVDSGNGWHALYALDLPNDEATLELVRGALAGLALAHSDAIVDVDVSVCNASRIFKLPGTWAKKGDSTPARPHRLSSIQLMPQGWGDQVAGAEQLAALAPPEAQPLPRTSRSAVPTTRGADDLDDVRLWIDEAMRFISPDLSYGEWISVGVALKDLFGGEGLAIFDAWSSGGAKYPGSSEVATKWGQLATSRHPGEEARTIIGKAIAGGFDMGAWRRAHNAAQAALVPRASAHVQRFEVVSDGCAGEASAALVAHPSEAQKIVEDIVTVGLTAWRFGPGRCYEIVSEGNQDERRTPFADDLQPVYVYDAAASRESGVVYRCRDARGRLRWGKIDAGCFVDSGPARKACVEAARTGVRVATGSGDGLAMALGRWYESRKGEHVTLVSKPGWHKHGAQRLYLQGRRVIGDVPWMADPTEEAIEARDSISGTGSQWRDGVKRLVTTPGLWLALGAALAGALLMPLGRQSFIINFYGDSTAGKSTALRLGAAVWGDAWRMVRAWDSTLRAMEGLGLLGSDACLCLDEMQRFVESGRTDELSRAAHTLAGEAGRSRMSSGSGSSGPALRDAANWLTVVLSSGEASLRDLVGKRYRGGDSVRVIDLPVTPHGELTTSAPHAEEIKDWLRECHGHAGELLVRHLIQLDDKVIRDVWAHAARALRAPYPNLSEEAGRVLDNLAVILAALKLAEEAGAIEDAEPAWAAMQWAAKLAVSERVGIDNPRERALSSLLEHMASRPAHYPKESEFTVARSEVFGVMRPAAGAAKTPDDVDLWTTEGMLLAGPLQGHSVRQFLGWIAKENLGRQIGPTKVKQFGGRWWSLDLEKIHDRLHSVASAERSQECSHV